MSIYPENERTKRAVLWISEHLKEDPSRSVMALVHQAIQRFDLTPQEGEDLIHFYATQKG